MAEKKTSFDSVLIEQRKFYPTEEFVAQSNLRSREEYNKLYKASVEEPEKFWAEQANAMIDWIKPFDKVSEWEVPFAKWFIGGKLNLTYNCLDRHVAGGKADKTALIWEGDNPDNSKKFTFKELKDEVCKFANVLKGLDVKKGDRVAIYLPMIPELAISMLACARIGAIHSIVFGGFSAEALRDRINDCEAKVLITSDGSFRGGKTIPLKANADKALEDSPSIEKVAVVKHADNDVAMADHRDLWWHEVMKGASTECEPEAMDAEDPLFILYTSGSTGKPKGVLHTQAGYLLFGMMTAKYLLDLQDDSVYWCTADIGWITGHTYIVYGILGLGVTSVMFEGVPNYPKPDRFWRVVEKYKVNVFYTAPTAIRAIMRSGEEWPNACDMSSLKLLGTVGEPINPEAWMWYYEVIGKSKCPIVDTYWQTETGGILICTPPGVGAQKPGSAGLPFFGVEAVVKRDDGSECEIGEGGYFAIKQPWPGIMRNIYKDPERFQSAYFGTYPGMYLTGDGAVLDDEGYFRLMGRVDDVINVSGHRLGTMEVESALVAHSKVAEAAVVPLPHEIKGQGIYAFVTLISGVAPSEELRKELVQWVRKEIGPIATPDVIQFADALPKTRSGKIMRRILKRIAANKLDEIGDTSTLADASVVDKLISERPKT